ncbi:MAG: NUDIX hydrolase [Ktedonobacterales bacterium]|jgi:8-oxo-dGTP pyrophosphatase MutT (NUDIX family)
MSTPAQPSDANTHPPTPPVTPRPASATVMARNRLAGGVEVFMVRRHVQSEFVPDVYVFPGGSVSDADRAVEREPGVCAAPATSGGPTALGSGFRAAATRELFEEAGALVARRDGEPWRVTEVALPRLAAYRDGLNARSLTLLEIVQREQITLATDTLLHWAHWITPEAWPKRFDTHFFLVEAPEGQQPAHDNLETTHSVWITPEEALASFERGEFPLVFATIHQLQELTELATMDEARARFTGKTPITIMPRIEKRDGKDVILLPWE